MKKLFFAIILILSIVEVGIAGTTVLQGDANDSTKTNDAYLSGRVNNGDDTTNFGATSTLWFQNSAIETNLVVIAFPNIDDCVAFDANDIDSAVLEITQNGGDNTVDSVKVRMHKITGFWEEGTGTGADNEDWVCWKYRSDSCYEAAATARCSTRAPDTAWVTLGGDYNATILDSAYVDSSETNKWVAWTIPKAVCSTWYASPATNYGVILRPVYGSAYIRDLYSSERAGTTEDPRLTIYWTRRLIRPSFGYLQIGATTETDAGNDAIALTGEATAGLNYVSKGGAVIDSIYVYAVSASGSTESLAVALYEQPGGEPKHRSWNATLIDTIENITTTAGWRGINVDWPLDKGWKYCLTMGNGSNTAITVYYDAGGTEDAEFTSATGLTNPWTAGTNQSRKYSIYAVLDTALQAGMIGDSCYANANSEILANEDAHWLKLESKTYTASAGDFCSEFKVWVQDGDSIGFTLYEYDIVGDTPTVCIYSDTMDVATTNTWFAAPIYWPLTANKTYSVGIWAINGSAVLLKGSTTGGIADSTGASQIDAGTGRECPYSSTGNSGGARAHNYFLRVMNRKVFGYNPNVVPATSEAIGIGGDTALIVSTGETSTMLKHTAVINEIIDSVYVYAAGNNTTDTILVLLYTTASGQANDLLWYDTLPITSTPNWYAVPVFWPMQSGTEYCLAVASPDPLNLMYYDVGKTEDAESKLYSPPPPDPYGAAGTDESRKYGLYATYYMPDWGGPDQRNPTQLDVTKGRASQSTLNFGALTSMNVESGNPSTVAAQTTYIKMVNDPRTAGYTQLGCTLYVWYTASSSDPDNDADSLKIHGYVFRRTWGEGDNVGTTSDAGEADWVDAQDGSVAWGTAGALNTTSDIQAVIACSSQVIINATGDQYIALPIAASHLTEDFFDFGVMVRMGWSDVAFEGVAMISDDHSAVHTRPFFVGAEAPAAGGFKGILGPSDILDGSILHGPVEGGR
jgi:hypothetical protein